MFEGYDIWTFGGWGGSCNKAAVRGRDAGVSVFNICILNVK